MPAQGKEVVATADLFDIEQRTPEVSQLCFQLAFGGRIRLQCECVGICCRQSATVELAVGRQWQDIELHICCRHHVIREPCTQLLVQGFCIEGQRVLAHHIGDQTRVAGGTGIGDDDCLAHSGAGA